MIIAVVAGEGGMPWRIVEGIHAAGHQVFLIAVEELTPIELAEVCHETLWMRYPKLGKIRKECNKRGITELTMCGRIPHNRVFTVSPLEMDWTTVRLFLSLKDLRANTMLGAIGKELARWGITLISSVRYLGPYLAKEGVLTKSRPAPTVYRDITFGEKMARGLGALDIGQTVVVKNGTVVAVEGMEGTDHCLERAGEVAGPGCVVIKMPKPGQDMRFDVPVIGINTIEKLAKIQAAAIAIEADRTILIDKETLKVADDMGVSIVGLPAKLT